MKLRKERTDKAQVYCEFAAYNINYWSPIYRCERWRLPKVRVSEARGGNEIFDYEQNVDQISARVRADVYRCLIAAAFNSLNIMPNTRQSVVDGRVSLSESIASATTLFLQAVRRCQKSACR